MLRKASAMSNSANIDLPLLYDCVAPAVELKTGHYQVVAVDEHLHYQVNFVQFRYCWDWGICPLYGIQGFPHFRGLSAYTQAYGNAFETKICVCNIVDGHF